MTIEDRYIVDVADIGVIRFVCVACSSGLSVPVDKFAKLQAQCPGCGTQWFIGNGPEEKAIYALIHSLRGVSAINDHLRVRFEMLRPKP